MKPQGLTGPGMVSQAEGTVQVKAWDGMVSHRLRHQDRQGAMSSCPSEAQFPNLYTLQGTRKI